MCNLYSMTSSPRAILEAARAMHDHTGNLPVLPGIFPDYLAPVVRNGADSRELIMARWGMPSSRKALLDAAGKRGDKLRTKGKDVDFDAPLRMEPDSGVTNIRNIRAVTGPAGWESSIAASCLSRRSANLTRHLAAMSGSPSMRQGPSRSSPGSGPDGPRYSR